MTKNILKHVNGYLMGLVIFVSVENVPINSALTFFVIIFELQYPVFFCQPIQAKPEMEFHVSFIEHVEKSWTIPLKNNNRL